MKVLLIYPYHTSREATTRWYPAEPLGLLYIATYLAEEVKKQGRDIQIRIRDAHMEGPTECTRTGRGLRSGMTDEEIKTYVTDYSPEVVGITNNYTFGCRDALDVADLVKQTLPSARVVMGGAHATLDHRGLAAYPSVDVVVRGEGEVTFLELCFALQDGRGLEGIAGITWRSNNGLRENAGRDSIANLDDLPIPDRSLIPYEKYLSRPQYFYTMQSPVGTVFTSRGCPFRCVFCSTQKTWGNRWRGRSARSMLQEAEYLRERYGVKEIAFQDDQFLGDRQRIIEFCKLVVQKNMGMTFIVPPGNSPALLNEEVLDWMAKAGFYRICFSVDVGTDSAVKYVRKPVNLQAVRQLVRYANQRGIWTYGTFVIGFPYETKTDILETARYAYRLKLDFLRFYIAQPHFGSDLYERYVAEGRLKGSNVFEPHNIMDAFVGTDHIDAETLINLRNQAECGYARHHWRDFISPGYLFREFVPKISSWRKLRYFLGLAFRFLEVTIRFKKSNSSG